MDTGSPSRSDLQPTMDTVRCRRRRRSRRHPRASGVGIRRVGWAPTGDRLVHVDRMSRWLCGLRAVSDPRPGSGFFDLAHDLCCPDATAGGRRRASCHRAGRDARRHRRAHRDRAGDREARLRRGLALERGAGRLHERSRPHHHRGPAAQALWVLDGRRRLRSRAQGLRARARRHGRGGARGWPGGAGHLVGAVPIHQGRPRGARRHRRRDRRLRHLRPARAWGGDCGHAPSGNPEAVAARGRSSPMSDP